ncbi:FtsK/SpoIIIE domain-containing protein [Alloscardovia theropitheci]|nr:FtsK/SpoIIIE domain-containing protein [Alloscardovia theropitheci]
MASFISRFIQKRSHQEEASTTLAKDTSQQTRRHILRIMMLTAPLLTYAFIIVWMILNKQWAYLIFLLPTLIMTVMSLVITLMNEKTTTSSHEETAKRATQELTSKQKDQQLIDELTRLYYAHSQSTDEIPKSNSSYVSQHHSSNVHSSRTCSPNICSHIWKSLVHSWLQPTCSIVLGSNVSVDLPADGPHALIAGTTGSGKSVLLQRWAVELASHNSPNDIHFVFLDFKGGATFHIARMLPHCVGSVNNLDLAHAARAIRALIAEMIRREKILSQFNVSSVDDLPYHEPRLIIIADEFFVLISQLPQYSQHFSTLISQGRSLGIHCIICTQNPINQVSTHIKANMPIHICLRVIDALQSLDFLGSTAASQIPRSIQGGAFIHSGTAIHPCIINFARLTSDFVSSCYDAMHFMRMEAPPQLFSGPMPNTLVRDSQETPSTKPTSTLTIGMSDDGMCYLPYKFDFSSSLTDSPHNTVMSNINAKKIIVLTHMPLESLYMNMTSIIQSLQLSCSFQQSRSSHISQSPLQAGNPINTKSVTRIVTRWFPSYPSHDDPELSALLHDPYTHLIIAVPTWSRFLNTVSQQDRHLWEQATIITSLEGNSIFLYSHHSIPPEIKELIKEYSSPHPQRCLLFDKKPIVIQFFSINSGETLENLDTVWFPILKED